MAGTITRLLRREHKTLAAVLADARRRAALTQRELASTLGWPLTTVQRIETGQRRLAVEELFPYAAALNTTPERVLRALRRQLLPDAQRTKSAPDVPARRPSKPVPRRAATDSRRPSGRKAL